MFLNSPLDTMKIAFALSIFFAFLALTLEAIFDVSHIVSIPIFGIALLYLYQRKKVSSSFMNNAALAIFIAALSFLIVRIMAYLFLKYVLNGVI